MMPHLAPQSRQHESPEIRPAQVLQEEVEKMIRSGQEPSTTKIKDIEKLVSGEILPELQATHSMAQMDITMMSHAASATNQNTYQELQTTKHTMEVQVMHARDALSNCRTAEAPLNASKVLHCSVRDRFLQGIEVPSSLPSERSPALMGPYLDAMSTYFYPKHGEFVKLDTACINATSVYDVHRSSCNMMQAQYELDFCTWRTRMMDICSVASHMYAQAVATYRNKEASTKVLEEKMKTEYTAIKKILCYVNVWLSDSNTSTASQTVLEACNMFAVDTSPMDVSYPGVPCATTCDTSATAAHPGTEAFAAGYANYSQAPATITPCMAEGSPLAATPAPAPAASTNTSDWDLSGNDIMLPPGSQHPNSMLKARFKTTAAAGTIVGKPFAHGLWRNGGSAGQGKMLFLRGGHVGFDIGWVGYFGCAKAVNDGLWHETALRYVAGESTQYQLFVDDMSTPCSKGLFPTADHPDTSIVIGKAIGHAYGDMSDWANGDMAPAFSGEIVDISYVALGADGSPLATTPAPTAPVPAPAPAIEMTEAEAKKQCGSLCLESNFCCNNPDIGSNQLFSCSQACMVRYYGASEQECLNLVNTQTQTRGCSRSFGAHSFSFCFACADLTDQCPWGVQSGDASQKGCTMDVKTNQTSTPVPTLPPTQASTWKLDLSKAIASQSSTGWTGVASRAIDGNADPTYWANSCTHTYGDSNPWWQVDLGSQKKIAAVNVTNRADCCSERLNGFNVSVDGVTCASNVQIQSGETKTVVCDQQGSVVKVDKHGGGSDQLTICEFVVLTDEAPLVDEAPASKNGTNLIPKNYWDLSGDKDFILKAKFKTMATGGTIVGKPFADGLWKSGGSAGQGKMVFLRGGKVGMDIGWVGYFACPYFFVNDGNWHEVALKFVKEEGSQYQIFVDSMEAPCSKGLRPVPDNPDTSIVIGKSIGHSVSNGVANGDMAPDMVGEIVDVSYTNIISKSHWDLSGDKDFILQAKFKTHEAGGTIVS